jgi:hypothetical protein
MGTDTAVIEAKANASNISVQPLLSVSLFASYRKATSSGDLYEDFNDKNGVVYGEADGCHVSSWSVVSSVFWPLLA